MDKPARRVTPPLRCGSRPLRYADLIALAVATPVLVLSGAPVAGYGAGVATWLVIRGLGLALERVGSGSSGASRQTTLWLGYRLARILVLAGATIAVREAGDENAGITSLAVIVSAFTLQQLGSLIDRHERAQHSRGASL
jgi:hypothetical protein